MNDGIHTFEGVSQTLTVTYVTDEVTQAFVRETLGHLKLLQFITGVNHHAFDLGVLEQTLDKLVTERAGAAGDENGLWMGHDEKRGCGGSRQGPR